MYINEFENVLCIGTTKSIDGDVTGNHSNSEYDADIWITNLDNNGDLLWEHCYGGILNEELWFGFHYKSENNYVIAGQTDYGPSFDVACTPHGGNGIDRDFWVFEVKDTTVNVNENGVVVNRLKVYPNPAKDYVVFEFDVQSPVFGIRGKQIEIQITNIFGQEVAGVAVKNKMTVWDVREVNDGFYFYQVKVNGIVHTGKIMISTKNK